MQNTFKDIAGTKRRRAPATPSGQRLAEDQAYDQIRRAIIERRLPPDTKLSEEKLAEVFSISRARVRRVLVRLVHDKMVVHHANRGAYVALPTPKEARDVFTARRIVEEAIMRLAVKRQTPENIAALRAHVAAEHKAAGDGNRLRAVRLSGDFHLLLAEMAGNGPLIAFLRELIARSSLIIAVYERPGFADCSHEEHAAVLDFMEDGDADRAATAMARHLDEIEARLNLSLRAEEAVDLKAVLTQGLSDVS